MLSLALLVAGASCQAAGASKKVSLNYKKLVLTVGQKKTLKLKNTKKKVQWNSSNKKIVTVSKSGVVKAIKKGNAKVTAKIGGKKYSCQVTVKSKKADNTPEPTASAVPEPSVAPSQEPTQTPEQTPDSHWEEGKKSGTEEDYLKYFDFKISQYQLKQGGTELGSVEPITYYSEVVGADREAYVYLPPNYSTDKKYPVLYMIHGIGCDRGQWVSMRLNEILSNMICRKEVVPFVAVIPSVIPKDGVSSNTLGPENIGAFTMFEEEFLKDLEPYVLKNYSVSADRKDTGVCGLSMGGMEALHLGFSIKDHFNYIGSFSAAPTLNQDLLTLEGWKTTPETILICTGTADGTVGENPNNYHMTLEKNGVDHIWYQFPKGGHDDRVWKNGLVNFLKRSF